MGHLVLMDRDILQTKMLFVENKIFAKAVYYDRLNINYIDIMRDRNVEILQPEKVLDLSCKS